MSSREYWMVQYRRTADEKMKFHFAECESEAQALVKKYRADGFHATAWAL